MVSVNGVQKHRPRVLVTDKVSSDGLEILKPFFEVHERVPSTSSQIEEMIHMYDGLIVRSETQVTSAIVEKANKLRVIARAGVGVDNIDVNAATAKGIIVVNSPTGNIAAAAEHTIALLMALARHIPAANASLKAEKWERSKFIGIEVRNKTLGIIGLGKVGLNVARSANGLGMKVVATDPYASPDIASSNNVQLTTLENLLSEADFLSLHTPLLASTNKLIGQEELLSMKNGARILNVARGGLVDEVALLRALESGHIAGAAIDVFSSEPPLSNSTAEKLIAHPAVIATPHLGASTAEAQVLVAQDVCQQVLEILSGDHPRSAVNAPIILPEELRRLQPYVRLVEKMGHLYTQHYKKHHHSFDITYEGDIGSVSTSPLYAALVRGLTKGVSTTQVNIVNAVHVARDRGIIINEHHSRTATHQYSSLITLKSQDDQVISGFVAEDDARIVRLDRFSTSFRPEGNIIICHNYDRPGMIGSLGVILGGIGVNINYMTVAPLVGGEVHGVGEALMILGVDQSVDTLILEKIGDMEGILDVAAVEL